MKVLDAMRKLHEKDHFGEEMGAAMSFPNDPGNPFGSRRPGRKRGPIPQWTEDVRASVAPDMARALRIAASRRSISFAALVRQIFDAWLKANEEAWN